jgi:Phosphoenolpyruvate carboxykinase
MLEGARRGIGAFFEASRIARRRILNLELRASAANQGRKTMHRAGPFNPAFGAEGFGLKDLESISYNFEAPRLVKDAIRRGEALVAKGGALSAETGIHTGRSPNDKFTVRDAVTDKTVWWDNNKALTPQAFDTLYGGAWPAPRWVQFVH